MSDMEQLTFLSEEVLASLSPSQGIEQGSKARADLCGSSAARSESSSMHPGGGSPRYVLWENVPGALSSGPKGQKGEDFGCLLRELEKCGYGLAWRILDSQFARVPDGSTAGFAGPVPQRRRRVFLVGSLGSDGSGDILFERTCMRGDHPKGREAREALARDSEGGAGMGDSAGFKWYAGARARGIGYEDDTSPTIAVSDSYVPAVLTPWDVQSKRVNTPEGTSPTLPSGTGEGMNIQPIVMTTANTNANGSNVNQDGACYTLDGTNSNAVAFAQNTRDEVRLIGGDGSLVGAIAANPDFHKGQGGSLIVCAADDVTHTLDGANGQCVAHTQYGDVAGSLTARADSSPCVDRGQNVVCMQDGQAKGAVEQQLSTTLNASHEQPIAVYFGDCGLRKDSDECNYAKYLAEHGSATYEYVCCSCGHRFMSGNGPVNTEMDEDWYRIRCPKCGSGRYVDASRAKTICAADDNGKTAIEEDLCGSLKVGGGSP